MFKYFLVVPVLTIVIRMVITDRIFRHSTRITGYVYTSRTQVSFQTCVEECQHTVLCHSVNYDRRKTLCEINSKRISDLTNDIATAVGFVYWEKQFIENTIECGATTCRNRESCDEDSVSCAIRDCESFYVNPAYGTVTGNMKAVNDSVYLDCFSDNVVPATTWTAVCKETGLWDVPPCEPVCGGGWIRFRQSCYKIHTTKASWFDSKAYCEGIGSTLVIVNDREEQVFLSETSVVNGMEDVWIGLRYVQNNRSFLWLNGSPLTFTQWYPFEPDYNNRVHLHNHWGYLWNDAFDSYWQFNSICEKDVEVL